MRMSFYTALALFLAMGMTAGGVTAAEEMVIRIGHAAPLTGPQAHLGKDNENGVRLAIDDLNAKGFEIGDQKVRFELVSEDDQADPRQGAIVAQKLVDENVNGVIGHLNSGTTLPASRIYHDAGMAQISPSATNPKYTLQGFETAFRVMANDEQQGRTLGEFAVKTLEAKTVAIIDDRTAYGQGLADEFKKSVEASGGKIVDRQYTSDKATDFAAILTSIKGKKPKLVFFGGMDAQGGPLLRQMKQLGLTAVFLGGDGVSTPAFIKLAGDAAEGQYSSLPGVPLSLMPGGPDFERRFTTRFGKIQLYAPYCYDAVMVMADAMQRAGSSQPSEYLHTLHKTNYQGVTTRIRFDSNGDLRDGAITVYQVKGGQWEAVKTFGG